MFQTLGVSRLACLPKNSQVNDFPFPYKIDIEVEWFHGNVSCCYMTRMYEVIQIFMLYEFAKSVRDQNQIVVC